MREAPSTLLDPSTALTCTHSRSVWMREATSTLLDLSTALMSMHSRSGVDERGAIHDARPINSPHLHASMSGESERGAIHVARPINSPHVHAQ